MIQFSLKRISTVGPKSGSGGVDGYLRPDQFLDHLTVIITQSLTIFMHHVRNKASIVIGTAPKKKKIFLSQTKNNETPPPQCWWSSHVCWLMITLEWTSLWKGGQFTLEVVEKVDENHQAPQRRSRALEKPHLHRQVWPRSTWQNGGCLMIINH